MFLGVPTALAALADDTRIGIVEALATGERSVGDLVSLFDVSQPAISRHLRVLCESGVVDVVPAGKQRIYRLNPEALDDVRGWAEQLKTTWEARFDALGAHLDNLKEQRDAH